ncbi:N-acetyl-gamma-glutamyl-phosphate reductase [Fictibacillus phosphorivorans]|uniref:N-acetyl-gamma-glutamyl-phosphate reductase n=1 Tax=Fictibacillus phosphorivorans TaxID=1221500 RepID=A0A160IQ74_9BACL|nr:N-acetyl-gamma-glutamyl-phosphate reductase [Fictibacillus phosphorivorans]ANC78327.1 N-acetyl-gamma-glutamyl-phosphate reductase [Fictibacillus phosphorivorans]
MRAGIIGVTGYGGMELFRLLSAHTEITEVLLYSSSRAGKELSEEIQHLSHVQDQELRSMKELPSDGLDIVFSSAPSGISTEILPSLVDENLKIIDLAGDYRIKDADTYRAWYKKEPPPQTLVNDAVYGLTEWKREEVQNGKLIANPGCFPTAALIGILPLLKEKVIHPASLVIDAKSGISGAGATPGKGTHFTQANDSLSIYKIHQHQHTPEIEQTIQTCTGSETKITFHTHLVPMTRGIMTTMYAELTDSVTSESIKEIFDSYYDSEYFVRVHREKANLFTKQVYGSNFCDVTFAVDERTNRITVVSCIDNLLKGAAGQAVQNMNVMFGMEETKGLEASPMFP